MLTIGSILMGATNIAIAAMSSSNDQGVLFGIFVLMVLLICFFATTIGPIAWVFYQVCLEHRALSQRFKRNLRIN